MGRTSLVLTTLLAASPAASAPDIVIDGDRIAAPLTATPGEAARGRAIIVDRQKGLCLLCHTGPFAEQKFQGNLAPDLEGVGSRLDAGQLRLRLVDSTRLNPLSIMPPYYRTDGFQRVATNWRNRTILGAQDIEDVIAFLTTLQIPQPEGDRK